MIFLRVFVAETAAQRFCAFLCYVFAMVLLCFVGANVGSSNCEARLLTCHTEPSLGSSPFTRTLRYARRFDGVGWVARGVPLYQWRWKCNLQGNCTKTRDWTEWSALLGLGEGHPASKTICRTHRAILQDAVEYHWHPGGLATEGCSACIVGLGSWSTCIPNVGIQILAASHTHTWYTFTHT